MQYDERITTYFGDAVLRAGFMPVPHLLMRHYRALDLSSEHAMFALQLMEINWDLGQPPATMRKIADRMGISIRTAQRYSEYLAVRGLIVIYEQFENGAQVENGYDLAPLFRALAAFAPEPRPGGTPRERRRRTGALTEQAQPVAAALPPRAHLQGNKLRSPRVAAAPRARDNDDTLPRDSSVTRGGVRNVIPPRDTPITPSGDRPDTPGPTPLTGLKGVQESPKKHQEQVGVAKAITDRPSVPAKAGRSLRLDRGLSPAEVTRSGKLLDSMGLHAPVARTCAATLAPAEVLALAAYAKAAGLGTGWIAAQIYDFERRTPRTADLARRWDEPGARLAELDDDTACQLLELVDRYSPDEPASLTAQIRYADAAAQVQQAVSTVWSLMHDVRGGGSATRTLATPAEPGSVVQAASEDASLWHAVLERLKSEVAVPEYETWLRPARLLVLENDVAVIGTDNIFAREHLQQAHVDALTRAFAAELGRATRVDVVIG